MTRGSDRRDLPAGPSAEWIGNAGPVESWEYWGKRFGRDFSSDLRTKVARGVADFRANRRIYDTQAGSETEPRWDRKRIQRSLLATRKSGGFNPGIEQWAYLHSSHLGDATAAEKADYLLAGLADAPDEFLMERPKPEPIYTKALYELFHSHGINVSLGSTSERYSMSKGARENDPLETAFIEFVRRCIWDKPRSLRFCDSMQKLIARCPICSKLPKNVLP